MGPPSHALASVATVEAPNGCTCSADLAAISSEEAVLSVKRAADR